MAINVNKFSFRIIHFTFNYPAILVTQILKEIIIIIILNIQMFNNL